MKKLAALVLAVICSMSLALPTFAADAPDAYELYKKASGKLEAAKYLEVQFAETTEVFVNGEFIDKSRDVTVSKSAVRGGTTEISTHTAYSNGETRDIYFKDGYYYHTGYEAKAIASDMLNKASTLQRLTEVTPELVKAGRVEELPNGNYRIHTQIKTKELAAHLEKSWNESLNPDNVPDFHVKAGTFYQTDTITPDGDWVSSAYVINMWLTYGDTHTRARINGNDKLISINKPLTIDFPSGLESYMPVPAESQIWN